MRALRSLHVRLYVIPHEGAAFRSQLESKSAVAGSTSGFGAVHSVKLLAVARAVAS